MATFSITREQENNQKHLQSPQKEATPPPSPQSPNKSQVSLAVLDAVGLSVISTRASSGAQHCRVCPISHSTRSHSSVSRYLLG